jgi:hypothetical protein
VHCADRRGAAQHAQWPAGRIPTVPPKPRDPMIMVGDTELHAVPSGTRALCGYEDRLAVGARALM